MCPAEAASIKGVPMFPSLQAATKEGPKLVSVPGSDLMRVRAAAASSSAELKTDKNIIFNQFALHLVQFEILIL